jgi:Fur family ferric uptake transcriptional regulator
VSRAIAPPAGPPKPRSTRQKRALSAVLEEADGFLSAQELHAALRARGERVGLTTVYNQLRALAEADQVDSRRAEDGETLYRLCDREDHHHHLVCRACGRTVEVADRSIERWAATVADSEGFVDVAHTVEVVGTCKDCASAGRSGADEAYLGPRGQKSR